jgi:monoamine oxidase
MRARSPWFQRCQRWWFLAARAERSGAPVREVVDAANLGARESGRRRALGRLAGAAVAASAWPAAAAPGARGASVGVVGAGLAGLQAARALQAKGAMVQVYEADTRVGGRVWSLRGFFPGQVAERGGELIDTTHTTMRGLVGAFGLTLESYQASKLPGEERFFFFGRSWSEAEIVEHFRAFVPAMRRDLTRLSAAPSALSFNAFDEMLDWMPLSRYLDSRGASPLLRAVLDVAYTIEFGRSIDRQSALALLYFVAVNRRRAFTPFGVFSDERFHVVEGNDAVPRAMAAGLKAPPQLAHKLVAVASQADGRVRLSFDTPGGPRDVTHDAVVLTLPAPAMRRVQFASSVPLSDAQQRAIATLDYGTNSKTMVAFRGRPWWERANGNGASYSDLPNHQGTWETNPSLARNGERGVLTDFAGGERGARLNPARASDEAESFLLDLEKVFPGSAVMARRGPDGRVLAHLENWSQLPHFEGAYTNNQPGYFTTIEGLYGAPAGRVHFAGEHTDSFYDSQGFMEGALVSGARAADEILSLGKAIS